MTTTTHASFVIERLYSASPKRVFAAWSDPVAKRAWFVEGEGWDIQSYEIDFREGGSEKHLRDIRSMLATSPGLIDAAEIAPLLAARGLEELWRRVNAPPGSAGTGR